MFNINVITQIIMFMVMAMVVNKLHLEALLILFFSIIVILILNRVNQFVNALKRFRWLFLVLMIIYTFNTPGEHIEGWTFNLSPTYEGIIAGLTQALRISVILVIISWIMAANTKQQIVSGFYFILSPFKFFGLETERFAARLWLTLHYVELQHTTANKKNLKNTLKSITQFKSAHEFIRKVDSRNIELNRYDVDEIEFMMPKFHLIDYAVVIVSLLFVHRTFM